MEFHLAPSFKGGRDYVHGTDLFEEIIKIIMAQFRVDTVDSIIFRIHKRMSHSLILKISKNDRPIKPDNMSASFLFRIRKEKFSAFILEDVDLIKDNRSYQESEISKLAKFEQDGPLIKNNVIDKFTLIEQIVALNKELCRRHLRDLRANFWFAEINIEKYRTIKPGGKLEIYLREILAEKYFVSDIHMDSNYFGTISFSLSN